MSTTASDRPSFVPADPAPLGLAAFALTTFLLAGTTRRSSRMGSGSARPCSTAGSSSSAPGCGSSATGTCSGPPHLPRTAASGCRSAVFVLLGIHVAGFSGLLQGSDTDNALAWFLIAFAIFNTYMLLWSTRVNIAVFGVFLTLEVTEIVLAFGFFRIAHGHSDYWLHFGGWLGIVTAAVAWYTSAAGVVNGMPVAPSCLWADALGRPPGARASGPPLPRRSEG